MYSKTQLWFQFYTEVSEVDVWMEEKISVLSIPEYGKDEDAVQVNYKINENPINYDDLVSSLKQIICRVCKFGSSYQTLLYSWTKMNGWIDF